MPITLFVSLILDRTAKRSLQRQLCLETARRTGLPLTFSHTDADELAREPAGGNCRWSSVAAAGCVGRFPQLVVDGGVKAGSPLRGSRGTESFRQPRPCSYVGVATAGSFIRAASSGQR